jgi:hypothetical protein
MPAELIVKTGAIQAAAENRDRCGSDFQTHQVFSRRR